ncbi:hypothetical protein ACTXT7_013349 [Hymenolepis weldensis]
MSIDCNSYKSMTEQMLSLSIAKASFYSNKGIYCCTIEACSSADNFAYYTLFFEDIWRLINDLGNYSPTNESSIRKIDLLIEGNYLETTLFHGYFKLKEIERTCPPIVNKIFQTQLLPITVTASECLDFGPLTTFTEACIDSVISNFADENANRFYTGAQCASNIIFYFKCTSLTATRIEEKICNNYDLRKCTFQVTADKEPQKA